jgi:hypothetical protein
MQIFNPRPATFVHSGLYSLGEGNLRSWVGKNPPPKFYNSKFYLVLMNQKSQYKITLYIVSIGWAQITGLCLCLFNFNCVSRVAQSVQCLATGWTTGQLRFNPRHRRNNSSCSLCVQNSSGVHNGYRGSFPRV